ncbi:hypothetical protein [Sphaerobacter thermophilus]|jgi:hypothetical protein|uniref:Uncharacterized protein n=1 Tax=Sphaerobacter thermophilus (strain ATCC 49802 / DSM 20745 / KCCM 41009 / NCIMB 13125 / S 6022) TaxID=479434 RepID=D1C6F7_SPHTD|nr:hypothetical protein [Sphaerobacter thermophilus]ACZ39582.1 hypothetical protein Sthe_2156 [Sphaerobacter thermophilus DSM 20745]PZN65978.1 MAG: hypothetical protein DIU58_06365 [Sphaerobacter thermophilus]
MVDEDLRHRLRETKGSEVGSCDVCGRTVPRASLVAFSRAHPAVEQTEAILVCPECAVGIEQGEITLDDLEGEPPLTRLI